MRFFSLPGSVSGAISAVGDREEALGYWVEGHLLRQPDAPAVMTVATWSGTLAQSDDPFSADLRNWSVAARSELHDKLDRMGAAAEQRGVTGRLLLRPHARHILSDWHTCARFMSQRETAGDARTGLLVDPAALLTAQMLPRSVEHLERTFEQVGLMLRGEVGSSAAIAGVVVSNVRRPGGAAEVDPLGYDEGEGLIACPLDDPAGVLDVKHLVRLAAAHLTTGTPVVFVGGAGAGERQRGILEA
jgi:hypothetical protein